MSGTGLLYDYNDTTEFCGRCNPKIYSDIDSADEITSPPSRCLHHRTDAIVQEAAVKHEDIVKTATICPHDICGREHGPGRRQSVYIPLLVEEIKKIGAPFYVNEGSNARGWVHIDDLTSTYLALIEAAAGG